MSCRLPWRLFDPVFQSLPLGQTCFSSVCCTPALEAAAALRQTMGCCARLAPPSSSCRSHFLSVFLSPLYLSLSSCSFFLSVRFSPSLSLSLSLTLLPFGHAEAALPQHGHPGCPREGKRPGPQRSSPPGRNKSEWGDLSFSLTLLTCSFCLYSWLLFRWKSCSQSSPPTLNLYLLYLFNCWCLAVVLDWGGGGSFLLSCFAADPQCGLQIRRKLCCCCSVIWSRLFQSACAHGRITKQQ